jgi:hypothetical protein
VCVREKRVIESIGREGGREGERKREGIERERGSREWERKGGRFLAYVFVELVASDLGLG